MWVRADLRRRWRSWVVLGLLAGVSAGIAMAGFAGARRTHHAVPAFAAASQIPDAAVLPNDPRFDDATRAKIDRLPEVSRTIPFMVSFNVASTSPKGFDSSLLPLDAYGSKLFVGVLVDGRAPDPRRADEITVNEVARDTYKLPIGATVTYAVADPETGKTVAEQKLRVVGISKSVDKEVDSSVSSGFYAKYREQLAGFVNEFVELRGHGADFAKFQADVQRVVGRPVNVESGPVIFGLPKILDVSRLEQRGLLLFSLTVLLGAGALVGQALVRAVSAGGVDLPTWRAIGADRRIVVPGMVAPALLTAGVAVVTSLAVAVGLSPRFPIAHTRRFELDLGFHADWTVLLLGAVTLVAAIVLAAWATAELRLRHGERTTSRRFARATTAPDVPPSLLIGARLATEPGRGRRAVPVRSALVGAIVGVLGFVGCLTFRQGLTDSVSNPQRSGIVWDYELATIGVAKAPTREAVARDPAVASAIEARWGRAITIHGQATSTFGVRSVKGQFPFVVTNGRAPRNANELALAPKTADDLGVHVDQTVRVGPRGGRAVRVVGIALVPATSHTSYDTSAWMTAGGLAQSLPDDTDVTSDFVEDYILVRWKPGADVKAAEHRLAGRADFGAPAELPPEVVSLGEQRSLPLALAIFFALLASATVAHALVTTVRRRGHDLAILRSIGFTRRDARFAIAWQSTLLAVAGLAVGVPLGIIAGRVVWRQLADSFPLVYVPPLALLGVVLVAPIAVAIANLLAAGPAHAATRVRPAEVLRTE
jgi:ABC-type lipoprotein release transport system permease subunit